MARNGYSERQRHRAVRIAKLRQEGVTTNEIARLCNVEAGKVKTLAILGERIMSIQQ